MATVYANNITSGGAPKQNVSLSHARVRTTIGVYEIPAAGLADTENIVFGLFKSSDRILDIRIIVDEQGTVTAGAMNVGLWTADLSNDGLAITVADADVFASATLLSASIAWPGTSIFEEATTLESIERGQPIYTYMNLTADPGVTYAVVGDISTTVDEETDVMLAIDYIAGD